MDGRLHGPEFTTTHWSAVLEAGNGDAPEASAALEQLCRTYWYPLYVYVRHRGFSAEDAQDLTQAFFSDMFAKRSLCAARPERGKFRSFLLVSLQNFLVDQHRHASALKRGGGQWIISLDDMGAEDRFCLEPHHDLTPEKIYERTWARTLLDRARFRLREEYAAAGKAHLYFALKDFPLSGRSERSFQQAAADLGMTVPSLKSAVHRLRARYRELVRQEVAHTVADPVELNEEAQHLIAALSD